MAAFSGPFETTTKRSRHIIYNRPVASAVGEYIPQQLPLASSSSGSSASSTCSLRAARVDRAAAFLEKRFLKSVGKTPESKPASPSRMPSSDSDAASDTALSTADTFSRPGTALSYQSSTQSDCLSETLSQRSRRMSRIHVPIAGEHYRLSQKPLLICVTRNNWFLNRPFRHLHQEKCYCSAPPCWF